MCVHFAGGECREEAPLLAHKGVVVRSTVDVSGAIDEDVIL